MSAPRTRSRGRARALRMGALLGLGLAASLAAIALAGASTLELGSAANAKLGERVLVDPHGRTLYALRPETSTHLLCSKAQCLGFWPPLTVRSRAVRLKAGAGVHGRLALLRRSGGQLQVTLDGRPLYRFSGDHAAGQANGAGIRSFGGTWHAVSTGSPAAAKPTPAPPTPSTTPSMPGYGY